VWPGVGNTGTRRYNRQRRLRFTRRGYCRTPHV